MQVDIRIIERIRTQTEAIRACQQFGGIEDKALVGKDGIVNDLAQWSRIKSGKHFFPQDKFYLFMDRCGNEIPLISAAFRRGYGLVPLETEMERRLRLEREKAIELERENALLKKLLTGRAA
jgi:hypothetical protein